MKKIAVTGNIGSGKSYAMRCIETYGVFVLNMDLVAKEVREEYKTQILSMFSLRDEKQLAEVVFQDAQKREQLEKFLYPHMIEKMQSFFKCHQEEKICVVEVALLFEKGWDKYFDEVWCVYANRDIVLQRLSTLRNMDVQEAEKRMATQMNAEEKKALSDFVLYNNEGDDLCEQIKHKMTLEGYDGKHR